MCGLIIVSKYKQAFAIIMHPGVEIVYKASGNLTPSRGGSVGLDVWQE